MKKNHAVFLVIGFVLVAALSFYAGTLSAQGNAASTASVTGQGLGGGNGGGFTGSGGRRGGGGGFGGGSTGTILSKDDKSVTIALRGGGSKIVFLSDTTEVDKMDKASLADLAVGQNVVAMGATGADGSMTAKTIQIRLTPPPDAAAPQGSTPPATTPPANPVK